MWQRAMAGGGGGGINSCTLLVMFPFSPTDLPSICNTANFKYNDIIVLLMLLGHATLG